MASTDIVSRFFRQITQKPPLITANRPAPFEVVRMLNLLQAMSGHLSGQPSYQTRSTIIESKWPRILLWLAALLKPLRDFINPAFTANERYTDMTSRCVVEVYTFLNSIASPLTSADRELEHLVTILATSTEMFTVIATTWVVFFTREWPIKAHCEVTSFLVMFGRVIGNTTFEDSFPVAVKNVCPNSELLPMWSAAIAALCARPSTSTLNSKIQTANRGLLIAATTAFFQPLPTLDDIHITLAQTHKLWGQLLVNSYPPGLCYVTIHSLAKYSLVVVSGGRNWAAKALDADLLGLLTKTLRWIQMSFSLIPDMSIHDVSEQILHLLLLYSIYKPVRRGVLGNMKRIRDQPFEGILGADVLQRMWDDLVAEIRSPAACCTSAICFQEALENIALTIFLLAIVSCSVATALSRLIARSVANGNIGNPSIKGLVQNSS
ncbi:hypothetical protein FB446DRAFT_703739 [Lentinula raphanica]|nr:hypothetical protein FB446DRAFT_703739 [Lentinula raphanica]